MRETRTNLKLRNARVTRYRGDLFAAIKGGEGYETIWEREPSDA